MRLKSTAMVISMALCCAISIQAQDSVAGTGDGPSAYIMLGLGETPGEESAAAASPSEMAATETGTGAGSTEAVAGTENSDGPPAMPAPAASAVVPSETLSSGDEAQAEDILLAEIQRLLAERDELYESINELNAENRTLREVASESEFYRQRSAELEAEIARLEQAVESKDGHIALLNARLEEAEAGLADERARVVGLEAARQAAEAARQAAEAARQAAEAALAAARESGAIVPVPAVRDGYLSGWRLDTGRFPKKLRDGFAGSRARLGTWKISGATVTQSDPAQFFSRLELPVAQLKAATLYRFKARSTGSGWVGIGLHLFVEDVVKKRGYGEGKSLLIWLTRDRAARGDDATYAQLYRSDDDVVMERMFDAELADGIDSWRLVEIVYDPKAEYIALSVDGVLRVVYKTFFGRDAGATVSLRTLGGGASFSDFSVWSE